MISILITAGLLASAGLATETAYEASMSSVESEAQSFGPEIGTQAPAFTSLDSAGATQTLTDLSGENGTLLYFNRSVDWCSTCLRQATEVDQAANQFIEKGWNVVILTHDSQETLAQVKDRRGFTVPLLADPGSVVIDAFNVRDPVFADPKHKAHGVPYPVAFAISKEGEVVGKFWHEPGYGKAKGYKKRVTPEDVLNELPSK